MNVQIMRTPRSLAMLAMLTLVAIFALCSFSAQASARGAKKVTLTGNYAVPVEESFGKHGDEKGGKPILSAPKYTYKLRMNPRTTKVIRGGKRLSWKKGKKFIAERARVTVTGTLRGFTLKVKTIRLAAPSKKGKSAIFNGTYRVAVIPYNFSNDTSTPYTVAGLRDDVFTGANSATAYWREVSHDLIKFSGANTSNFDGDVTNWVTIPNTNAGCDYTAWGNAAISASGINPANYDRILFVQPLVSTCRWGGVADTVSRAWFQQAPDGAPNARVIAHEFGHNFNLNHAGGAPCPVSGNDLNTSATMSSVCYTAESANGTWQAANPFNIMGYADFSMNHISAYQKIMTGVMPTSAASSMATPGTYTLYPSELASASGPQLLQAARPGLTTGMFNPTMYAEYRQPYGLFDQFNNSYDDTVPQGVQFSFGPGIRSGTIGEIDSSNGWPQMLLDGEPDHLDYTTMDWDSLKPRESFFDYASNLVYTVLSADSTSAQVETRTPPAVGNRPTVAVTNGKLVYDAGANQHNSLYVRENTAGDALVIVDNATPITAGVGCTAAGESTVSCPYSGFTEFEVNLGDLADSFRQVNVINPSLTVDGGTGGDLIDGVQVTASYANRTAPLNISLNGSAGDGEANEGDLLAASVRRVVGGSGNDTITGSAEDNTIDGGLGNDVIDAAGGGNDVVTYANRTANLTIRLNGLPQSGATAQGETDTLSNFESATGGAGSDDISGFTTTGGSSALLDGGSGDDTLTAGGPHYQTYYAGPGNDTIIGTANSDIIYGDDGNDRIDTGAGPAMDYVAAGSGSDTLDYANRAQGRTINVASGGASGSGQENDQFNSVEAIVGTGFVDTITGDANANTLSGGAGNDTINGGDGADTIVGDAGTDTLDGGNGNDALRARDAEIDSVTCGADTDTARIDGSDTPVNGCETATQWAETTIDAGIADGGSSAANTQQFAFSSDTPGVTFECSIDGGAWTACVSAFTTPTLTLGAHTFQVRSKDVFGAVDGTPASRSFTIISPAPDTVISAGLANGATVDEATATYAFNGVPSATSFECSIDSGSWSACTSPYTTPTLSVGTHTFNVRAVGAGGADPSPASRSLTVAFPQLLTKQGPVGTASTVPLTTDSTLGASVDWIHWKNANPATVDRKSATQQISTFQLIGSGATAATRSDSPNYTWTDAVGTASGSSKVGVTAGGASGRGFRLTVPATNTQTRTLKLYVGMVGYNQSGKLSLYLNGQTPVTDTTVTGGLFSTTTRVFTITYRSASASDTLNVEWTQNGTSSSARAVLYAAGLYNAQTPDTTISSGPAQGATITTSTANIGFTSTVSGSTFKCKLDQNAWVACTSAWTTPTLTTGLHTVRVRATAANGSVDQTPAVRSFYKG